MRRLNELRDGAHQVGVDCLKSYFDILKSSFAWETFYYQVFSSDLILFPPQGPGEGGIHRIYSLGLYSSKSRQRVSKDLVSRINKINKKKFVLVILMHVFITLG